VTGAQGEAVGEGGGASGDTAYGPLSSRDTIRGHDAAEGGREKIMNTREFLIGCFRDEKPKFLRVLRAVPPDQVAYRPHPRSSAAGDIVWLLAAELGDACEVVDHGRVEYVPTPAPPLAEAIARYENNALELEKRLARLDDASWGRNAEFLMGGKVVWEAPLGQMLWGFLFDAIHHRGQLSSYLRPMGAKVPSIYGPSADDTGA
jgi:hypothetical protein